MKKSLQALFAVCLVLSKMYITNIFVIIFATITTELVIVRTTTCVPSRNGNVNAAGW